MVTAEKMLQENSGSVLYCMYSGQATVHYDILLKFIDISKETKQEITIHRKIHICIGKDMDSNILEQRIFNPN